MFGCAAVVRVPVKKFALTKLAPEIVPPVPEPTVMLPVVDRLPPMSALPEALIVADDTAPAVVTLPPVIRPAVDRLPTSALPDTDTDVSVPTEVIFGCAFV